ncbi:hypothetical protein ACKVMT_12300 [Halobacteriales archaeon Cl-PHB]
MTQNATDLPVSRHDVLLAAIGLSLFVAGIAGLVLSVPLAVAMAAGSVPASGGVGYALFYRPPNADA